MAKAKQRSGSAAQRREQERQQRHSRLNTEKIQPRGRRGRGHRQNNPWPLVIGILVMCAAVIGVFVWLSSQPSGGSSKVALNTIEHINPSLLETVGTGSAQNTFKAVAANGGAGASNGGTGVPTGTGGKPIILYFGGEYCPYCAAQRWSLITALGRFGTFGPINPLTSSELSVPTFSFEKVTYTSSYLEFQALETSDNNNKTLDTPSAEQAQLFNTYDNPPYTTAQSAQTIPFILFGNKLVANGAFYSPQVLVGLSYDQINSKINDTNSDVSRGMLGTANYLTAAICMATNNQPASVCGSSYIQTIEKGLPTAKALNGSAAPQVASAGSLPDMNVRRQD